jgi:hypothetical protein
MATTKSYKKATPGFSVVSPASRASHGKFINGLDYSGSWFE